jgi:hypothetical protein
MAKNSTIHQRLITDKAPDEIKEAIKLSFQSLGGTIEDTPSGIMIRNGKNGVQFGYAADFTAYVNLYHSKIREEEYDIECFITWGPNATTLVCAIVGIFTALFLWIVPITYMFITPDVTYMQALQRVQTYLL